MFRSLLAPKYWPGHLAMVVCVGAALILGLWQLDAWQTRRADAAIDVSRAEPVPLASLMDGDSAFPGRSVGRPVSFTGTWMNASTLYVADRELDGRPGYWVVTPVLVDGSPSALPVVRGWSAEPVSTDPTGQVEVTGWLQATEGSGPLDPDPQDRILPGMRLASMVEFVDADLYSAYVVAREVRGQGAADGSELRSVSANAVPPVSSFTALRNFLYGIEWWVFGAFAFFVWFRWCKDSLEVPVDLQDAVQEDA